MSLSVVSDPAIERGERNPAAANPNQSFNQTPEQRLLMTLTTLLCLQKYLHRWSEKAHEIMPSCMRTGIFTVVLCIQQAIERKHGIFPREVLKEICGNFEYTDFMVVVTEYNHGREGGPLE